MVFSEPESSWTGFTGGLEWEPYVSHLTAQQRAELSLGSNGKKAVTTLDSERERSRMCYTPSFLSILVTEVHVNLYNASYTTMEKTDRGSFTLVPQSTTKPDIKLHIYF